MNNIIFIEDAYRAIVVDYYDNLGEHEAVMYQSNIKLTEAQKQQAEEMLAYGADINDIAQELFSADFN